MPKFRILVLKVVAFVLFVFTFFPVIKILVRKWANSEDYAHAFLVVPIIAYMVWKKKQLLTLHETKSNLPGLVFFQLALFAYVIFLQSKIDYGASLSMVAAVVGILLYLYDYRIIHKLMTPLLLLFFLIPFPGAIYSSITLPLQLKVSQVSEIILQCCNIPIFREGNIISAPGKTFQIVQACSGIRSIMTLITLSLIIGYFSLNTNYSKFILLLSSIPIAFFVNVLRVVVLITVFHYYKVDLSIGNPHTMLGIMVFVISLIAMFSIQRIIEHWEKKLIKS